MNFPFLAPEDVVDLGMTLREAGYGVGPDQCIVAQRLIVTLAAQGVRFADRRAYVSWLAPVFCGSPTEQADFASHYDEWLRGRHESVPQATPSPKAKPNLVAGGPQTSRVRRMIVVFAVAAFVAGASLAAYQIHYELAMRTVSGQVVDYSDAPVGGAAVSFRGVRTQTDKNGSFPLSFRLLELPAEVTSGKDGFEQSLELNSSNYAQPITLRVGSPVVPPPVKQSRLDLTAAEADFLRNTPHVQPRLPDDLTLKLTLRQRIYRRHYWLLSLAAAALPLLLTVLWMLWKHLPRLQLIRWKSQEGIRLDNLRVKGSGAEFFTSPGFRRITQQLRRHRLFESSELDAERTVVQSAGRGGWFTPVYLWQKRLPDFLVLIDRAGFRDLQGHLIDDLVRNLRVGRVEIDCYDFYSDPRTCYLSAQADKPSVSTRREQGAVSTGAAAVALLEEENRSSDSTPAHRFSLEDLLAKHPSHNLFIFSDTSGFFSALSGQPQPWVEQFSQWMFRALLVPERMVAASVDQRSRILQDTGFLVLSATERGLATAVEVLDGSEAERADSVRIGRADSGDGYPSLLSGDDLRWLSDLPPRASQVSLLVGQLRAYLGAEGFQWLCACAIYPELLWDLTIYLGHDLKVLGNDEQRLSLLLRLPWFRHGNMPDWLRERLTGVMAPSDREKVRSALWRLLETALEKPLDGLDLPYATDEPPKPLLERIRDRLRTKWLKNLLSNFIETEPAGSPLRDYVFLSALHGRKPGKGLPVPETLREVWRRFGEPRHRVIQLMAGVLATTAVSVAMYHYRPKPLEAVSGGPQPLPAPTGPPPYHLSLDDVGNGGKLVFQTTGDTGSDDPVPPAAIAAALTAQARAPNTPDRPAFLYLLGNLVYDNGAAKNYLDQFYRPYRDYPGYIFAIPGNYDGTPAPGEASLQAFVRNFGVRPAGSASSIPSVPRIGGQAIGSRRQPNAYWTLETPFATIIGLYSNVIDKGFIDDAQQAWLVSELKNAPADKALIVAVHHPIYSEDLIQASDYLGGVLDRAMLAAGRAPDLVLSAHDKIYQRFARQLGAGGRTISYVLNGVGGYNLTLPDSKSVSANLASPIRPNTELQYSVFDYGFLRFTVTRSMLTGEFFGLRDGLNRAPAVLDSFSVDLAGPAKPLPAETLPKNGLLTILARRSGQTGNPPPFQIQDQRQQGLAQVLNKSQQPIPQTTQAQAQPQQALPQTGRSNVFDNWNTEGVVNNPTQPTRFTIKESYYITHIWNYHWNNGRGAAPGSIGLRGPDGTNALSWPASASAGQGGTPNAGWESTPNVTIPAGTYEVTDSAPGTWSQNSASDNAGFSRIEGYPVGSSQSGSAPNPPSNVSASAEAPVQQTAPATKQAPPRINVRSDGASRHTVRLALPGIAKGSLTTAYNIYRSTTSGGPYERIASGVIAAVFTDNNVRSGQAYFYVVRAVDGEGRESSSSSEFAAKIP